MDATTASLARSVVRVLAVVGAALLLVWVAFRLREPLTWLAAAAFLAVIASGPVALLERRRLPRPVAIAVVYLGFFAVPIVIWLLISPALIEQATALATHLPGWIGEARDFLDDNETLRRLDDEYGLLARLQASAADLPARVGDLLSIFSSAARSLLDAVTHLTVVLVLSILMLRDGDRWVAAALRLAPSEHRLRIEAVLLDIRAATIAYVRAQLTIALIAAVVGYGVMTALGIPFREPLALVIAFGSLLPLVGSLMWGLTIGIVTVFSGFPETTIAWAAFALVYPQFENNVLQPQLQKRAVDVDPFVVIVAVLCGATLAGIGGVLVAIPVAAALQIALREWWAWRQAAHAATVTPGGAGQPAGQPAAGSPRPRR